MQLFDPRLGDMLVSTYRPHTAFYATTNVDNLRACVVIKMVG